MILTLLCAALMIGSPQTPRPDDDAAKARLKSALDATGLKYEASASGLSFTLMFDHEGGKRKQKIYLAVKPGTPSSLKTHMIYTTVWLGKDAPPDEALMRKILGRTKKLGSFYLFKDAKGIWVIRFRVHFDATNLKETSASDDNLVINLKDMIYFVSQVGDETDKDLNGDNDIR